MSKKAISPDYLTCPPCTDISQKAQAKLSLAFSCSCTRELEKICFRARVLSSPLACNHPIAALTETIKLYAKSCFQFLLALMLLLQNLTQMRV